MNHELQTALEAARRAAILCNQIYGSLVESAAKTGREPVTIADYASQTIINTILKSAFPNDLIIGEEHANEFESVLSLEQQSQVAEFASQGLNQTLNVAQVKQALGDVEGNSGRKWIIDPIDGTKGFLAKRAYAVAIALFAEDELKIGVLACPNLSLEQVGELTGEGVLFYAVKNEGAFQEPLNGGDAEKMTVKASDELILLTSVESGHSNQDLFNSIMDGLPATSKEKIGLDGQGKYGLVANGNASAYFRLVPDEKYREKIWDHAAGAIIVQEAGGQVTDFDGQALDFGSGYKMVNNRGVVVSNGALHSKILTIIAERMAE